jgi:hypothetical protein
MIDHEIPATLRAFEQGGIFIVPQLLRHGVFELGEIFIVLYLL